MFFILEWKWSVHMLDQKHLFPPTMLLYLNRPQTTFAFNPSVVKGTELYHRDLCVSAFLPNVGIITYTSRQIIGSREFTKVQTWSNNAMSCISLKRQLSRDQWLRSQCTSKFSQLASVTKIRNLYDTIASFSYHTVRDHSFAICNDSKCFVFSLHLPDDCSLTW